MEIIYGAKRAYESLPATDGGADANLVTLVDDKPHCTLHGAMNKVSPSPPGIWRCVHSWSCRAGVKERN